VRAWRLVLVSYISPSNYKLHLSVYISHDSILLPVFVIYKCWSVVYLGFGKGGGHGERAEREPITGVWGPSPQRGPGTEPLVGGLGGQSPRAKPP